MKTDKIMPLIGFCFVALLSIVSLNSCKKKSETVYSCNPKVNNWVKSHTRSFESITRAELVTYPIEEQFGIFRSLSNQAKKNIFVDKVNYILAHETFSASEIAHLNLLKNNFEPDYYDEGNAAGIQFIHNWENEATNNLGWDDVKLTLTVGTWLTNDDLAQMPSGGGGHGGGGGGGLTPDCNCLKDAYCSWMTPTMSPYCNKMKACNVKGGCGLFGWDNCLGKCLWTDK